MTTHNFLIRIAHISDKRLKIPKEQKMKIVKDNYNVMKITCHHCKSILEVYPDDISGGEIVNFFCICAACDKKIVLNNIPQHILRKVEE